MSSKPTPGMNRPQFCEAFAISDSFFWKLVANKDLKVIKIGSRVVVPGHVIDEINANGLPTKKKVNAA